MVALAAAAGELPEAPGPGSEAVFACPLCNPDGESRRADDCKACGGTGRFELAEPAETFVDDRTWQTIVICEMADKGTMPVAGGTLDQANSLLATTRLVAAERQRIRDRLEKRELRKLK